MKGKPVEGTLHPDTNGDAVIAYLLLRTTLGLNIFIHGLARLLGGPVAFAHTLVPMFGKTPLPAWSVYAFG